MKTITKTTTDNGISKVRYEDKDLYLYFVVYSKKSKKGKTNKLLTEYILSNFKIGTIERKRLEEEKNRKIIHITPCTL